LALFGVKLTGLAGNALGDDFGVFVDVDRHIGSLAFDCSDNFLRGLGHAVSADDWQTAFGQHLLAQVFVGALHAHYQRHGQVSRLASRDDARRYSVALP
jgi:hypothetical protein